MTIGDDMKERVYDIADGLSAVAGAIRYAAQMPDKAWTVKTLDAELIELAGLVERIRVISELHK